MNTKEKKAYLEGLKGASMFFISLLSFVLIAFGALIKSGIYVL